MTARKILALVLVAALGACGGDDDDDVTPVPDGSNGGPDGGGTPDGAAAAACAELAQPAGTIDTYPGSFDGDVVGAGGNLHVVTGICTIERSFFDQMGEDQVVALTGLTAGQDYVATVTAAADLSVYVVTGCTEAEGGPANGQCLIFADETSVGETVDFTAPAGGNVFVVIDQNTTDPIDDGTYSLAVAEAECATADDCPAEEPICQARFCLECVSLFDCSDPEAPICDSTGTCAAGPSECVNDDGAEDGDDGIAGARALGLAADAVTTLDGSICSAPADENDFFVITVGEGEVSQIGLTWDDPATDLDLFVYDATGAFVDGSAAFGGPPESVRIADYVPGDYYVQVTQFDPEDATAVTAYHLSRAVPNCETSFDCTTAEASVCTFVGQCGAGPDSCEGDDAGEGAGDDGPAGARALDTEIGVAATLDGAICNDPVSERDYYSVVVADGDNLAVTLDWEGVDADLDLFVLDSTGEHAMGLTFWSHPEIVTLTNLPAGTYQIEVSAFSEAPDPAAIAYTITAERTAGGCADVSDCGDEFDTQLFRGNCAESGACEFIDGAGTLEQGATCDSFDDCASDNCTYLAFESDAAKSVCTVTCGTSDECEAALGAGFTCTAPFFENFCIPACTSNSECGVVDTGSSSLDPGLAWDYMTCTDGVCDLDP